LENWRRLLEQTFAGLHQLAELGHPIPEWTLGGGTALMLVLWHRESRDIDAFIDDSQYLGIVDPELGAESIWNCVASDRQSNYVKIVYPHGEIDFIAAGATTTIPPSLIQIDGRPVCLQHPVEVAISKMRHRPRTLKMRDIYDIAAVDQEHARSLADNLHHLTPYKADLKARLGDITPDYLAAEFAEINVMAGWEGLTTKALGRVGNIVGAIPDPA
jgi:hypothetical protein